MAVVPVRTLRPLALVSATIALLAGSAMPASAEAGAFTGRVLGATAPVAQATVYAYRLVESSLQKVLTNADGEFRFSDLPGGLYKIVAHKHGYAPTVTVIARENADEPQYLEVTLSPNDGRKSEDDYWTLRSEIPSDVLRDLEAPAEIRIAALTPEPKSPSSFLTEMSAVTGVEQFAGDTTAQMAGGKVGVLGSVGPVRMAVQGDFRALDSGTASLRGDGIEGRASSVRVNLEVPGRDRIDVATTNNRIFAVVDGDTYPIDFSQFQIQYRRPVGETGSTGFAAQYVTESGLYSKGWVDPAAIPLASRTLRLEGSYSRELADNGTLRAGLRYREQAASYAESRLLRGLEGLDSLRSFDAYGLGDWALDSTFVLQYGLYTTYRDGTVSLTPRGGLLVHFSPEWQATVLASRRVALDEARSPLSEFGVSLYEQTLACEDSEESCYQLELRYGLGDQSDFSMGASYREFDRTVRLFFSEDFFARSEGLFLVPGDVLPELHASVRRRLSPNVVTRLSSNFASGGGGAFLAQNSKVYENEVSFLSTALDTRIESSATGVYLAFHRVEQRLDPVRVGRRVPEVALERMELVLTQDLNRIFDLAANWAVRVGMELSKGATLFQAEPDDREALRHRLTTGFAVRF
ncbi:MAG: carboxypeptidase regulatory-like domain-containing protein [Holophagales bacterium]|nr:carboxypeptidase regulatory-like domain-containing protein [Holophagales bacterium]